MKVLKSEFEGQDGSFLIQLRVHLNWDRVAFAKLILALFAAAEKEKGSNRLERRIAQGFWITENLVRDLSRHPNFPKPGPIEYYEQAYQLLADLSFFYFMGYSPQTDDQLAIKIRKFVEETIDGN